MNSRLEIHDAVTRAEVLAWNAAIEASAKILDDSAEQAKKKNSNVPLYLVLEKNAEAIRRLKR